MTRPNLTMEAEVPFDFPEKASAAGFDSLELLWRLAEDFCARNSTNVRIIKQGGSVTATNIIAFPAAFKGTERKGAAE